MTDVERDQFGFHVLFLALAVPLLVLLPDGTAVGPWLLGAVVVHGLGTVALAGSRHHRTWLATWRFGALLSLAMVLADAVLVVGLGVLEFPPDGLPRLGPVALPMAGLWAVPTVLIVAVADAVTRRRGERAGHLAAAATAAVVLLPAELLLTQVPVWRAVGVATAGGLALYLVPALVLLGPAVLAGARWSRGLGVAGAAGTAAVVACAYTGAATIGWVVIERGLLG